MKFATGKFSMGMCGRCGMSARYSELVADGEYPGLRVHPDCRDIRHPAKKPKVFEDGIGLKHPAPDIDDDSPGNSGESIATAMGFPAGSFFGGGT